MSSQDTPTTSHTRIHDGIFKRFAKDQIRHLSLITMERASAVRSVRQLLGTIFSRKGNNTDKGHIHVHSYTPKYEPVIRKICLLHKLVTTACLCPPGKPSPSLHLGESYPNLNFYNIYLLAISVLNPTLSSAPHLCCTYNNVL